jgi:hypothetical protein
MEENNVWKQSFTHVCIGVKFLGIFWEFWIEPKSLGEDDSYFIEKIKSKYKRKFGDKSFYIRPVYPNTQYLVQ